MYKKILFSILLAGVLFTTACESKQPSPTEKTNNKIVQCLTEKSSEEDVNACFKDFLSVVGPTRLIIVELDEQLATTQYLSDRIDIFNYRLSQIGITQASINSYENKYIIILISDEIKNTQQEIIKQLGKLNSFEIRLAYRDLEAFQILANNTPLPEDKEIIPVPNEESALVSRKIYLTENDLQNVNIENSLHKDHPTLVLTFTKEGTKKLHQLTQNHLSKHLATLVKDGTTSNYGIIIVALVTSPIQDGRIGIAGQSGQETKRAADAILASIPTAPLNVIVNITLK